MIIYLCGRYGERDRFREIRRRLELQGITVNSRWLDTDWPVDSVSGSSHAPPELRREFAIKDVEDVTSCDALVSFSSTSEGSGRGGRHVEFGAALALGKRVIVVGKHENIFHHHPKVRQFDEISDALYHLVHEEAP